MTKTKAKQIALETMAISVGTAYYRISDDDSISEEDCDLILKYLTEYGNRIGKLLKVDYTS